MVLYMATIKVHGTLEIGKVVLDDWEIKPEESQIDFGYKKETVASVKAHAVETVQSEEAPTSKNALQKR